MGGRLHSHVNAAVLIVAVGRGFAAKEKTGWAGVVGEEGVSDH
jgi:hypothetical protein